MKIVINSCFGGFGLSEAAVMRYAEIKGITIYPENEKFSSLCGPTYYTVPKEQRTAELKNWAGSTMEERKALTEKMMGVHKNWASQKGLADAN